MSSIIVDFKDGDLLATVRNRFKLKYGTLREWGVKASGMNEVDDEIIPSEYLIVSVAGCAALHTVGYCAQNKLSTEGIQVRVKSRKDYVYPESESHTKLVDEFHVEVIVPGIPKELIEGLLKEVRTCTVMSSLKLPPRFYVSYKES